MFLVDLMKFIFVCFWEIIINKVNINKVKYNN